MRRLMTGYAVNFNLRHRRVGHLFQNRYKAILCDLDSYLLELVAYIHLNPLRAGVLEDLKSLREYKWCGHGALMGEWDVGFLAEEDILGYFGDDIKKARRKYESFIRERVGKHKRGELSSGGLRRSQGVTSIRYSSKEEEKELSDERILGGGDFVKSVLGMREKDEKQVGISLQEVVTIVREKTGVGMEDIMSKSRVRKAVKARALYCYLAKEKSGVSGGELMRQLKLTSGGISHLVSKGREYYQNY
jgi:putative transposase